MKAAPKLNIPGPIAEVFFEPIAANDNRRRFRKSRYKVLYGGRGAGKSESIARILVWLARQKKVGILCARMFQNSIADSVHKTVHEAIIAMGLDREFLVLKQMIVHRRTGSYFIFKGIQRDISSIKSLKGIGICWVEEAETVPKHIWDVLDPTFREEGSEIWISYNPDLDGGATHQLFVVNSKEDAIIKEVLWSDNPFFPEVLDKLRRTLKAKADTGDESAQADYDWIWEGKCRRITDAVVFRNRVTVEEFDEPPGMRPYYGADWGFADDPTTLIRSYIHLGSLFITHEEFSWHCEMDDIPQKVFEPVPGSKKWPMKGDAAQPMIISYLHRRGYQITAAEKWPGSVEDGIAYLKSFTRIVVHPRCLHIAREFRLYSWKTDPKQLDDKGNPVVLPIIVDKFNHGIDALRYSLDGYIRGRGDLVINPNALAQAKGGRR